MKLKAEIVIEIDAEDYVDAARHQTAVRAIFDAVRAQYRDAILGFRPMRKRPAPVRDDRAARRVTMPTGALHVYEDL